MGISISFISLKRTFLKIKRTHAWEDAKMNTNYQTTDEIPKLCST